MSDSTNNDENVNKEAMVLGNAFMDITAVHTSLVAFSNEKFVTTTQRHMLHMKLIDRLEAMKNYLLKLFQNNKVTIEVINDDILNPNKAIQFKKVKGDFLWMDYDDRDRVEDFMKEILKQYPPRPEHY